MLSTIDFVELGTKSSYHFNLVIMYNFPLHIWREYQTRLSFNEGKKQKEQKVKYLEILKNWRVVGESSTVRQTQIQVILKLSKLQVYICNDWTEKAFFDCKMSLSAAVLWQRDLKIFFNPFVKKYLCCGCPDLWQMAKNGLCVILIILENRKFFCC